MSERSDQQHSGISQRPGAREHAIEHRLGEPAGERVLAG